MHSDEICHAFVVPSICYRVVSQFLNIVIHSKYLAHLTTRVVKGLLNAFSKLCQSTLLENATRSPMVLHVRGDSQEFE